MVDWTSWREAFSRFCCPWTPFLGLTCKVQKDYSFVQGSVTNGSPFTGVVCPLKLISSALDHSHLNFFEIWVLAQNDESMDHICAIKSFFFRHQVNAGRPPFLTKIFITSAGLVQYFCAALKLNFTPMACLRIDEGTTPLNHFIHAAPRAGVRQRLISCLCAGRHCSCLNYLPNWRILNPPLLFEEC